MIIFKKKQLIEKQEEITDEAKDELQEQLDRIGEAKNQMMNIQFPFG